MFDVTWFYAKSETTVARAVFALPDGNWSFSALQPRSRSSRFACNTSTITFASMPAGIAAISPGAIAAATAAKSVFTCPAMFLTSLGLLVFYQCVNKGLHQVFPSQTGNHLSLTPLTYSYRYCCRKPLDCLHKTVEGMLHFVIGRIWCCLHIRLRHPVECSTVIVTHGGSTKRRVAYLLSDSNERFLDCKASKRLAHCRIEQPDDPIHCCVCPFWLIAP